MLASILVLSLAAVLTALAVQANRSRPQPLRVPARIRSSNPRERRSAR
jgi:hypothetical protein